MKNEDWQLLKTLYATKNLTQAARLLFITQPALTKRLQRMEKTLGCQLIKRSNKGISFTTEGEYLAKQANLFLDLMEETLQYLRSMGAHTNPVVRIGAPSSFAKYFLVDLLAGFHLEYPEISPQIRVDVSSEIPNYIQSHIVDCGFMLGDRQHSFTAHLYDTQQCYAVYRSSITLSDLPKIPLVLHNRNESTQQAIFQWWDKHFSVPPNVGIHVTDLDTALDMVANGLGYSIAFGSFLEKRPDFFLLPLYNPDHTPFIRNTWFLYCEGALSNPYVKCFINFVLLRLGRIGLP